MTRTRPTEPNEDSIELLDSLLRDIMDNLQVFKLQTERQVKKPSKASFRCASDAAQNIETSIRELQKRFPAIKKSLRSRLKQ